MTEQPRQCMPRTATFYTMNLDDMVSLDDKAQWYIMHTNWTDYRCGVWEGVSDVTDDATIDDNIRRSYVHARRQVITWDVITSLK